MPSFMSLLLASDGTGVNNDEEKNYLLELSPFLSRYIKDSTSKPGLRLEKNPPTGL